MVNISLRVLSKPDTEELSNIYKASALLPPHVLGKFVPTRLGAPPDSLTQRPSRCTAVLHTSQCLAASLYAASG